MQEAAVWLSMWQPDVGARVLELQPELLMQSGDPSSLSPATRDAALIAVVTRMAEKGEGFFLGNLRGLKQFVQKSLEPTIRRLWAKYKSNERTQQILLQLIGLGKLTGCADIAAKAAYEDFSSYATEVIAGRALLATASVAEAEKYGSWIIKNFRKRHHLTVWEALHQFFPKKVSISQFLDIYDDIVEREDHSAYHTPERVEPILEALSSRDEIEQIIQKTLSKLGTYPFNYKDRKEQLFEKYIPLLSAAVQRLNDLIGPDQYSAVAAKGALFISIAERNGSEAAKALKLQSAFGQSQVRRRGFFWTAFEVIGQHPVFGGRGVEIPSQMNMFGWHVGLSPDDTEWMFNDAERRSALNERRLLLIGIIDVWEAMQKPPELLARLRFLGEKLGLSDQVEARLKGWEKDAQTLAYEREAQQRRAERAKREEETQQQWKDFLSEVKGNPKALRDAPDPTKERPDLRLYNLWALLHNAAESGTHYTISSTDRVEPLLGKELTSELRLALKAYWRKWKPTVFSDRDPDKRNSISHFDLMGLTGVSLEASESADWASKLSHDDAVRAAKFGTLEINGLPEWFKALSLEKPDAARTVLMDEFRFELSIDEPFVRQSILFDAAKAGTSVAKTIIPDLISLVQSNATISTKFIADVANNVLLGSGDDRATFGREAAKRAKASAYEEQRIAWLAAAFGSAPSAATDAFEDTLKQLNPEERQSFSIKAFSAFFGYRMFPEEMQLKGLPFDILVRLIRLAFDALNPEDDNIHKEMFTPDERDKAEQARNALFNKLVDIPGFATFAALMEFAEMVPPPIPTDRLRSLAEQRAYQDSDHVAFSAEAVRDFEQQHALVARTPQELQRAVMNRFANMQYDFQHHRFTQRNALKNAEDEDAVQAWAGDRLLTMAKGSYSIEQDPKVIDKKRPDYRIEAKSTQASIPVEIKVAESWSLTELEEALTVQLVGRYIRERDEHHGILLLVHQKRRTNGWQLGGKTIQFPQVEEHLRKLAQTMAAKSTDAPKVEIAVLDVSAPSPKPQKESSKGTVKATSKKGLTEKTKAAKKSVNTKKKAHAKPLPKPKSSKRK